MRALVPKSALCAAVTVTEWQIFGPRTGGREPAEGNLLGYRSDEIATSPGRRPRILHGFCRTSRLGPSKPRQHGESMGRPRDTVVMTRRKEARRGMTRVHISRGRGEVCLSSVCPEEQDSTVNDIRRPPTAGSPFTRLRTRTSPTSPRDGLGSIFSPHSYM